jgi:hypothetical protein
MKETLLVAIAAALVGGAAGSLVTSATARETPAGTAQAGPTADAIGAAVARELAPLLAGRRRDAAAPVAESPSPSRPAARPDVAEDAAPTRKSAPLPVRELDAADPAPPQLDRLHEMVAAWEDTTTRRKWMFVSAQTVLARFGTPENVQGTGGVESWYYPIDPRDVAAGGVPRRGCMFEFHEGRLTSFYLL